MAKFDNKDVIGEPGDDMEDIIVPNKYAEGPIVDMLNAFMQKREGGSYHQQDPKRGHLSTADGCSRRNYLNYVHKLDDNLEVPPNDNNTNWTFSHGDAVHELIQDMLVDELGSKHVSKEETVDFDINDEYHIYGHADLVLRGLDDPQVVRNALPGNLNLLPNNFKGVPDSFIIDIKTTAELTYYNRGKGGHVWSVPKESNKMQLNGYMSILNAELGCLLYYSKRNDKFAEFWVRQSDELFEEAKDNITNVLDAVNTGKMPERDAKGSYMCEKFCKWHDQGKCPGIDTVAPADSYDEDKANFSYNEVPWA